jgi:hypothetical protein
MIKYRNMRWVEHVELMRENRNVSKILVRKLEVRNQFENLAVVAEH